MKFFKKEPINLTEMLNQPLWLNEYIKVNETYIYNKNLQERGILCLKDILDNNCEFLDYTTINRKYKVKTSFIEILQIK